MNSLLLRKARENMVKNMLPRPGRGVVGWRLTWRGAERHGAAWDEPKERTRRRKWDGPVVAWRNGRATTTQTSCARFASRLHSSSRTCTMSFQTSRCSSSGHAVHLVPCSTPRQLAPCSWVPPSLFGLGATQNGLMTMAAPTFSPRTRTSTRFTEQGHVKNGHSLLARWQKLSSETCSPRPSHRTTCIFSKALMSTIQKSPTVHVPRIMNSRVSWPDQRHKAVLPITPACRVGFFIGGHRRSDSDDKTRDTFFHFKTPTPFVHRWAKSRTFLSDVDPLSPSRPGPVRWLPRRLFCFHRCPSP